ncbi:alpha/beta fold hydrolase [Brevibacterium antiquum]|uniref:alpha/beta hydrolase family protein n=1 Tax=Brevibacterium antiquum TaxID=234835 RepID=UPI0018DF8EC8|nr:alpha/beta fold hydrolase [Brevibacterium antiquum]
MRSNINEIEAVSVRIPTSSGPIHGHVIEPGNSEGIAAVVVLHPATAVPERLYRGFAEFLAGDGFAVITYDYRGTGNSGAPSENRGIRMRDWMALDVPAVAQWAGERFPDAPQLAVGHSIGGHALSLDYGSSELRGFVTIASHAGVTAAIPKLSEKLRVGLVLRVLGPLTARLLGYVPGRRLGLGEDMPGASMLEWSRWSRLPRYFFDDPTMGAADRAARVTTPVLAIGFSDDLWATPEQIDAIADQLTSAEVERRTIDPGSVGASAIGHMGFFRRTNRDALWPEVSAWLRQRLESIP